MAQILVSHQRLRERDKIVESDIVSCGQTALTVPHTAWQTARIFKAQTYTRPYYAWRKLAARATKNPS
eukprot:3979027-Pleurochrysis_carterae.AAC.3